MLSTSLSKVIDVDPTKCLNCHACITACPVKFCNNGSGDVVEVNNNMCIACGRCIEACTHDARFYIDDFNRFIDDIIAGEKIVAISAPAVAAGFPETYLNLNGWLKELGVDAVFDVSFGAELTIKSYLNHVENNNPKTVIAQPCAAIITYIELYQPELIKHLAPADSPMLHTAKMISRFYPEYKDHKVAVLSPCNAKRREFDETGIGDYNIAHKSIKKFLDENKLNLHDFPEVDFDNPPAERAVTFSSPGGLLHTAERWIPGITDKSRKIEGNPLVYEYFKTLPQIIEEGKAPLIIDCLSCEFGCNAGPLTITKELPQDEIEYRIKKRSTELRNKYLSENENDQELTNEQLEKTINKYWEENLYTRTYVNRWENVNLKYPNKEKENEIFKKMHKYTNEDIKNCSSCGYGSCKEMAVAIFNKLNKAENCHFYLEKETELSYEETRKSKLRLSKILETALDGFIETDENQIIIDANPAMMRILKRSNIIGKKLSEYIDNEFINIVNEQIKERQKGIATSYELQFKQSDNNPVCTLVSATPLFDNHGNYKGSFAMISDITKLKIAEKELKQINESLEQRVLERTMDLNEAIEELRTNAEIIESYNKELERLSIVASETDNSIVIMDAEGNFEWVNKAYENLYGLTVKELIEKHGKNIVAASTSPDIKKVFDIVSKEKISANYNSSFVNNDGQTIYIHSTLSPVFNTNGELSNIVSVKTDITELKEAENEILQRNEEILQQKEELTSQRDALLESEEHVKNIIASLPDAAFVIDEKGKVVYWNRAIEKMTDIPANEMIGKDNHEYSIPFYNKRRLMLIDLVTEDNDVLKEKYKHIVVKRNILQAETRLENLNGEEKYILGTAAAFFDLKGNYKGAIEIIHDVTKRRQEQEALKKQKEEIESQRDKIIEQNQEITDSINYAARIQKALLPPDNNIKELLPEHFILYKPKDVVGGDFYWIEKVEDKIIIAAVDCTGHGVPGGFMSMLGVSSLNEIILVNKETAPNKILNTLREHIINSLRQSESGTNKDGMDVAICSLDTKTGILESAGAYNPIFIIRNDELIIQKGDRMPIGVHRKDKILFNKCAFQTQKGDIVYLFSDGFVDQIGITGRKFLSKNFKEVLLQIHKNKLPDQRKILEKLYYDWKGNNIQIDDILIIGFKI